MIANRRIAGATAAKNGSSLVTNEKVEKKAQHINFRNVTA
jgi:hypothetical protein